MNQAGVEEHIKLIRMSTERRVQQLDAGRELVAGPRGIEIYVLTKIQRCIMINLEHREKRSLANTTMTHEAR
jgi:hypothetical protein